MNSPCARFFEIIYIFQVWFSFIFLLLFRQVFNIFDCCSVFWLPFYFCFSWFFSTFMHIIDTCWFTIILVCVCFKEIRDLVFNTTHHYFFKDSRIWLINQSHQSYQAFFADGLFFVISFSSNLSVSSADKLTGLKNSSSIFFIEFFSYLLNLCLLVLYFFFLILKGYS